jgi:hypothetical protein
MTFVCPDELEIKSTDGIILYTHTHNFIFGKSLSETDYACASLFAHKIYYLAPRLLVKRVRCVYYVSASKNASRLIAYSKLRQTTLAALIVFNTSDGTNYLKLCLTAKFNILSVQVECSSF